MRRTMALAVLVALLLGTTLTAPLAPDARGAPRAHTLLRAATATQQPYAVHGGGDWTLTLGYVATLPVVVPSGKRLVIEDVACWLRLAAGEFVESMSLNLPHDIPWELVLSKNGEDPTYAYYSANQPVRLYANAGSRIGLGIATDIAAGRSSNTSLYNQVSISLSGYLVSVAS